MELVNEVYRWLVVNGYEDLNDWGADSDYRRNGDSWFDEDGNEVDLWQCLYDVIQLLKEK